MTDRPSSSAIVRLVAAREASTRLRDKNFVIGSIVMVVLLLGILGFQVAANSGADEGRIGLVGETGALESSLRSQAEVLGVDLTVVPLDDDAAARAAVEAEDVDGAVVDVGDDGARLLVREADDRLRALVGGALTDAAVGRQLAEAGVQLNLPELTVTPLEGAGSDGQAVVVALVGVSMLYGLLILFAQFVAQGVVEEKSSRVVELLLSTIKPWQLLAGKLLGLGLLGLGQMALISALGVTGALAFDLVDVPGALIGTVVTVVCWFVVGYAFYASVFAAAASLVSRQEDLGSVIAPTSMLLVVSFIIAIQAASAPAGTLATVTSLVPGLSPMVMPVRMAAGDAAVWEIAVAALLMLVAIAVVVRLGGRIYAGALLRTTGKVRLREALRADTA